MDFSINEVTPIKVRGNNVDFSAIEITSKKVREIKWILRRSKLHRKKFVEKTWIFRPAKLRKNSSKFGIRCIDVMSMSNEHGFDVVYQLGIDKA